MSVPWPALICCAGALAVALLFKKFAPPAAQTMRSPVWWIVVLLTVAVFGELGVALSRQ